MRKSPFLLFPGIVPCSIFVAQRFECNLLRRLLRLLPFCGTIVFDNAYPYLWFVRRPFGTAGVAQRAGLSMRNIVGVFWRIILFSTDSDGRMFAAVAGMRERRCGGIFRRDAVRPDGAAGYRRVPASSALFRALSRTLRLVHVLFRKTGGIIEAFREGGAAHVCLSEQGPSPLRNAGRSRPATSETMDYPV